MPSFSPRLNVSASFLANYADSFSKSDLLRIGHEKLGDTLFETWSCYVNKKLHCGKCESCNNRKKAFIRVRIPDKTAYLA